MTRLNISSLLLFSMLFVTSLGVFGQYNQLEVEQIKPIKSLNTKAEENVPVVNLEGNRIYFMRTYVGKKKLSKSGQEIWSSDFNGEEWNSPTQKSLAVNDNANNAVIGISQDNQRIYLFNSLETRHKKAKGLGYVELNEKGEYGSPIGIDVPGFEVGNGFYSFYVTPDEQQFFIAAAMDSTGYEDLFVSLRQSDGSWGGLINLGPQLNTPTIETTPFLTMDKRTLYFSSDGHGGVGQADIFYANRIGEGWTNWSKPVNMGSPINSEKFDANFIMINNGSAVFSSNRDSELSDLYEVVFKSPAPIDSMPSKVIELLASESSKMVKGRIAIPSEMMNSMGYNSLVVKTAKGEVVDTIIADDSGDFEFEKENNETYIVSLLNGESIGAEDLILEETKSIFVFDSAAENDFIVGNVDFEALRVVNEPIELVIRDENGEAVDTIITDAKGNFEYKALDFEGYSIALLDNESVNHELVPFKELAIDDTSSDEIANQPIFVFDSAAENDFIIGNVDFEALRVVNKPIELVIRDENGEAVDTIITDSKGNFEFKAVNDEGYLIAVLDNESVTSEIVPFKESIEGETLLGNDNIVQQLTVYFAFDSYAIEDSSKARINAFIEKLTLSSTSELQLEGHTDSFGPSSYNDRLAEKRTVAVKSYFETKGITSVTYKLVSKGEREAAASNKTIEGRRLNRRVNVMVK